MSIFTALLKSGKKRKQPDNDINDEPSNWWYQWGGAGSRFLFGWQSAPTHGNQDAPHGIVDGNIGSNGRDAVDVNEDNATNQSQFDDVNARDGRT